LLTKDDIYISFICLRTRWCSVYSQRIFCSCLPRAMIFVLQHLVWEQEWMNTIFSDKKIFSTDESGHVTLWRMRGTRYSEKNVRFCEWSGRITLGLYVMAIWSLPGLGPLIRITLHMNTFTFYLMWSHTFGRCFLIYSCSFRSG